MGPKSLCASPDLLSRWLSGAAPTPQARRKASTWNMRMWKCPGFTHIAVLISVIKWRWFQCPLWVTMPIYSKSVLACRHPLFWGVEPSGIWDQPFLKSPRTDESIVWDQLLVSLAVWRNLVIRLCHKGSVFNLLHLWHPAHICRNKAVEWWSDNSLKPC